VSFSVGRAVESYAVGLVWGGAAVTLAYLAIDLSWLREPGATAVLLAAVFVLRVSPVRLSKYSYLTQSHVPALVGALAVGPAPVVVALWGGVFASDVLWLRKLARAGVINAGREVLAFAAAFGPYAAVLAMTGRPQLSLDLLPALAILLCAYFFTTRIMFYFTLLVRDKLEHAEKILILRWEIISYLLTLIATVVVVGALQALSPVGWLAVALALGCSACSPGGSWRRRSGPRT
jgi:hypothetical protein